MLTLTHQINTSKQNDPLDPPCRVAHTAVPALRRWIQGHLESEVSL